MSVQKSREYFIRLYDYSRQFLTRLPIESEPQPLTYALGKLQPAIVAMKSHEIEEIRRLVKPSLSSGQLNKDIVTSVGLNTIGMLIDRLTILIMKEWCLRNKGELNPVKADNLYESQTLDIIECLAKVKRGNSALNTKITSIKANTFVDNWEEAYYGLLSTNVILWESQETLYIKDIALLPASELRDYIKWFSYGNIMRNEYIQWCEVMFWKDE